ncbi:eeig1/ehbp1 protein amino-terminal domain protein [Anaeramoeba ignava]|uniref:Eeig1/ehbp1 protein amino-terminal domain protein n=1 Tax=Anaeramoeba ignava TaxID=1746090 RepID=A0A9Q0LGT5_ANAIG|nr:eeig1/ehbp1 protein amino-terminal domain protein [Anaeramoeba ignava]
MFKRRKKDKIKVVFGFAFISLTNLAVKNCLASIKWKRGRWKDETKQCKVNEQGYVEWKQEFKIQSTLYRDKSTNKFDPKIFHCFLILRKDGIKGYSAIGQLTFNIADFYSKNEPTISEYQLEIKSKTTQIKPKLLICYRLFKDPKIKNFPPLLYSPKILEKIEQFKKRYQQEKSILSEENYSEYTVNTTILTEKDMFSENSFVLSDFQNFDEDRNKNENENEDTNIDFRSFNLSDTPQKKNQPIDEKKITSEILSLYSNEAHLDMEKNDQKHQIKNEKFSARKPERGYSQMNTIEMDSKKKEKEKEKEKEKQPKIIFSDFIEKSMHNINKSESFGQHSLLDSLSDDLFFQNGKESMNQQYTIQDKQVIKEQRNKIIHLEEQIQMKSLVYVEKCFIERILYFHQPIFHHNIPVPACLINKFLYSSKAFYQENLELLNSLLDSFQFLVNSITDKNHALWIFVNIWTLQQFLSYQIGQKQLEYLTNFHHKLSQLLSNFFVRYCRLITKYLNFYINQVFFKSKIIPIYPAIEKSKFRNLREDPGISKIIREMDKICFMAAKFHLPDNFCDLILQEIIKYIDSYLVVSLFNIPKYCSFERALHIKILLAEFDSKLQTMPYSGLKSCLVFSKQAILCILMNKALISKPKLLTEICPNLTKTQVWRLFNNFTTDQTDQEIISDSQIISVVGTQTQNEPFLIYNFIQDFNLELPEIDENFLTDLPIPFEIQKPKYLEFLR